MTTAISRAKLPPPLTWLPLAALALLLLLPLAVVVAVSLAAMGPAGPEWPGGGLRLEAYRTLAGDPLYAAALLASLRHAAAATLLCLLVGFPLALAIIRAPAAMQPLLLVAVIVPLCLPLLARAFAWQVLLADTGTLATAVRASGAGQWLAALGLVPAPARLAPSPLALWLGLGASYLPLMVLPLVVSLARVDAALLDAAADLGARPWAVFRQVQLPLARRGIAAGSTLVFVPCLGEVVVPELLADAQTLMVGRLVRDELFANLDWPQAAAATVALVLLVALPLAAAPKLRGGEP